MKEYQVSAEIQLDKNQLIEFRCPFEISSSDNQIKSIKMNSKDEKIILNYVILADSDEEAEERARLQLNGLANRISFKENIPIKNRKITTISWQNTEGLNINVKDTVSVGAEALLGPILLNETSVGQLKEFLEGPLKPQIEEYLMMYRQALLEESTTWRFYLLYRIVEKVVEKGIDKWIENAEPNVMKVKNRYGQDITIYTHLRHHIHPKQAKFPYKEISGSVPRLMALARRAIEEKLA